MKTYVDLVVDEKEIVVVPRGSDADSGMVLMPLSEYNSIKETEYLLSTAANREALRRSIEQVEKGETVDFSLEELTDFLDKDNSSKAS